MTDDPETRAIKALTALLKALPKDQQTPERIAEIALAVVTKTREGRLPGDTKRGIQLEMLPAEPRHSTAYTSDTQMKEFLRVANAAGHTLNSVAKAVRKKFGKGTHVNIGKALRGEKAIRPSWARHIASLTVSEAFPRGFEPTAGHWPGGWVAE